MWWTKTLLGDKAYDTQEGVLDRLESSRSVDSPIDQWKTAPQNRS